MQTLHAIRASRQSHSEGRKSVRSLKQDWRESGRMRISSRAAGKIKLADALLFDPGEKPGLVEFLLHPVPHCETRRRLFPCGENLQVRFSQACSTLTPGAEHNASSVWPWWTCRFVGVSANRQPGYYTRLASKSQGRISPTLTITGLFTGG